MKTLKAVLLSVVALLLPVFAAAQERHVSSAAEFDTPSKSECARCLQPPSFVGGWLVVPENVRTIERALTSYGETMSSVTLVFSPASVSTDAAGVTTYRGVVSKWSLLSAATATTYRDVPDYVRLEYFEPLPGIWAFPSSQPLYRVVVVDVFISMDGGLRMDGAFSARVQGDLDYENPKTLKLHQGTARVHRQW